MKRHTFLFCLVFLTLSVGCEEKPQVSPNPPLELWGDFPHERPSCVKGIHLTSWYVGSAKGRANFESLLADTELNTVVIDVKEVDGDVYIPGVTLSGHNVYVKAMPDLEKYLNFLKDRGVYTIARLVVFKDSRLPMKKPEWAIRSSSPIAKALEMKFDSHIWVDYRGKAWADPYNSQVWDYNIAIAEQAAKMGFQEIQFDYIRFPSDGNMKLCVYSKPHNASASVKALAGFLERAHSKLKPYGVDISIDVFGLTGSTNDDMGIGQQLSQLLKHIDIICPMMYPSHYAKGEYGLPDPNKAPYETIYRSLLDTQQTIKGSGVELRPYLQDFSLGGVKYTPQMVRDQIQAANDVGVNEWLLWNAACRYSKEALLPN